MDEEDDLETLGERLYDLIFPRHAEIAGKLTGMLLELPSSVLVQMLQNEAMLTEGLEKALGALQHFEDTNSTTESQREDNISASTDSLGEQLYDLVDVYNTGHTEKITGMLLEQKKEDVQKLLSNPELLEETVNVALKTLEEQSAVETDVSDSSDPEETEKLGERLFAVVQQIDSTNCADITGMLLEMDSETLRQVLCDQTMLEAAVQRAKSVLMSNGASTPEEKLDSTL